MVASLTGKVQGREVVFRKNEQGRWVTTVPASGDAYVMELWATDDAGNVGYFATIKLVYDPSKMCWSIEIVDVGAEFTVEDVLGALSGDRFLAEFRLTDFGARLETDPVVSEIIKCEVCGE